MKLSLLKENQKAIIINTDDLPLEIIEKGFFKGNIIILFKKGILGNFCFIVNGEKIAIDRNIADRIEVKF